MIYGLWIIAFFTLLGLVVYLAADGSDLWLAGGCLKLTSWLLGKWCREAVVEVVYVSYRSGEGKRRLVKMAQYYSTHQNNNTNMKEDHLHPAYTLLSYNPYISSMDETEHNESEAEYLHAARFQQSSQGVRGQHRRAGK